MRLDAMRCARTRERTRGGRSGDDQTDVATSASARVRRGRAPGARCAPRALLFVESGFFCRETGLLVSKKYASATIARRRHTSPPPTMASTLAFHPALAAASAPRARSRRASDPSRATLRSRAPPKRTTRSSTVGTSASSSSSSSSSVAVADDDTDAIDGVVPAFGPGSPPWPVVHAELKAATRGTVRTISPEEAKRMIDAGGAALADVRPRIEHEEFRPGAAADDDAAATSTSSSSTSSSSSAKYVVNVPYMVPHRERRQAVARVHALHEGRLEGARPDVHAFVRGGVPGQVRADRRRVASPAGTSRRSRSRSIRRRSGRSSRRGARSTRTRASRCRCTRFTSFNKPGTRTCITSTAASRSGA